MLEEQREDRQLVERGVIDILSETFAIYWRHFASFVLLIAVIQVPIGILEMALTLIERESIWVTLVITVMDGVFSTFVYAAIVFAVGQYYLVNQVTVGECYTRALWRVVSLAAIAVVFGILLSLIMSAAFTVSDPALTVETQEAAQPEISGSVLIALAVMLMALPVLLVFSIYMVVVMPALIVEGHHVQSALRRSFELTSNARWRILGHLVVYSFVAVGLLIAVNTPFFLLGGALSSGETPSLLTSLVGVIGSRASSILIAPVTFIAATLLYYDLRVRKENYDIPRLAQEMGYERA